MKTHIPSLALAVLFLTGCVASGKYDEWAAQSQVNALEAFGSSFARRCDRALRSNGSGGKRVGNYKQLTKEQSFVVLSNMPAKIARLGYDPLVNGGKPKHAYLVAFAAKFEPLTGGKPVDSTQGCLFDAQTKSLKLVSTLTRSDLSVRY